jgi:hypothetical protein
MHRRKGKRRAKTEDVLMQLEPDWGRKRGGGPARQAKLNWPAVRHIRAGCTFANADRFARKYRVTRTLVLRVLRNQAWVETEI